MLSGSAGLTGTILTKGLPRLVTMISPFPLCTSVIAERHFALKAPAPMVFIGFLDMTMVILPWS